jgi:guanine deaminase
MNNHEQFLQEAINLSIKNVQQNGGGPFGAVVVKDNDIIAQGVNQVTTTNDPTAHAEIVAIRNACQILKNFQLTDCIVYSSCEPCPMCLGAIFWARPKAVYFANTRHDAAKIGFDDSFIYDQLGIMPEQRSIPFYQVKINTAIDAFRLWHESTKKIQY